MKFSKQAMNTVWLGSIVICVALCLFALLFTSCTNYKGDDEFSSALPEKSESTPAQKDEGEKPEDEDIQTSIPIINEGENENGSESDPGTETQQSSFILGETADAGREYLDKFVFLGDSTTYGIGYYYNQGYTDLCPPSQVWTPSSGTLALFNYSIATVVYPPTGAEIPISEAVTNGKPEYMLLTIGVNGVAMMDEEWFIRDYKALIDMIKEASPDTKIILNSIYPVANSYAHIDSISNEKIAAANEWIKRIAEDSGCKFLNTYEILVGDDGALPESKHNGDGIHLSGETFGEVMNYIRTHAYN